MHPYSVAANQDRLFVANSQGDNITVINLNNLQEVKLLDAGETPENIAIDAINDKLVSTNWGSDSVTVFDLNTLEQIAEIKTGLQSRSFGQFIYRK